jgi:TPR repeat protein
MRNTKLWLAACLALLGWSGRGYPHEANQDDASLKRAKGLLEQGVKLYRANDFATAAPLFLEAARLGHPGAQLQIGWHYRYGKGVPRNPGEAARWYARSAQQGNAIAQCNLGSMYEDGEGVREDWIEAARWYARSAKQNYRGGLVALARAYMFGIGVPQNRAKAVELYTRAADQGDEKAAHWARYYRNPTNASSRTEGERQIIGLMPTVVPWDPVGRTFRDSAERSAFLREERQSGERTNAQFLYLARKMAYDNELREYNEGKRVFPPVGPTPPAKPVPSTTYRFSVGVVAWIDSEHLPFIAPQDVAFAWDKRDWWNRVCIGLVGTTNNRPRGSISDLQEFRRAKQFRALMWGELYVKVDRATDRVIQCRLTDKVLDPGWTPPFNRGKVVLGGDIARFGPPAMRDPKFYPGELSPVSNIYTRKRHPNSAITLPGNEQVVADGLIKFRAGNHTDELGIRECGSPFHVPWTWSELAITYAGNGTFRAYTRGAVFPTHRWYVGGYEVWTALQAEVRMNDRERVLTTGAPAAAPQPEDDSRPGTAVSTHRYTLPPGEQRTWSFGPAYRVGAPGS